MAAPRDRRHILVPLDRRQASAYTWPKRAIKSDPAPAPASRKVHGDALKALFAQALTEAHARRGAATVEVHGAEPGVYVEFEGRPGATLKLPSLENRAKGIEVVAATDPPETPQEVHRATVFVPEAKTDHFVQRIDTYSTDVPKQKNELRHEEMLDPVAEIRLSALRGLWTDAVEVYPAEDETIWWEVWLRRTDGRELERFLEYCGAVNIGVNERRLEFDDRIVVLAHASPQQLAMSMDVLQDMGEVRKAKEGAAFFLDLPPAEQADWADTLRERTTPPGADAPAVALLDTGITRAHPLLEPAVAEADVHTVDPEWGVHDTGPGSSGHGTPMMGLALYGDLSSLLAGSTPVRLRHCGESVKILPPDGDKPNDPQMYGTITADATSQVETEAPDRRRCFVLAITADDVRDRGRPTSWSAAIDALAAGRSFDATTQGLVYLDDRREARRRLFVVSAGNMSRELLQVDHLTQSDLRPVQDPAHAWNALTVGAYTELVELTDPDYAGWAPLAEPGDLSPYSTTSVPFADEWPLKPDVVHEGGNLAFRGDEVDWSVPDLSVLTTHARPQQRMFIHFTATSAATAQVARLAAILVAEYPDYEPETIRALIVHSARWTPRMKAHMKAAGGKAARARLVRRYGYGVPSLERALRSAKDALTLVAQGSIRPYDDGSTRELDLYSLPWPKSALQALAPETLVHLRVTLSYFVEPNPARRGWQKRHQYASHGLRFAMKSPTDSVDDFQKRINQKARADKDDKPEGEPTIDWYLGLARDRGSLHSDSWTGTAAALAECGMIAVYPVGGWWKEQPKRDRSALGARYALVISLETDAEKVDIWTPVATEVGIPAVATAIEL